MLKKRKEFFKELIENIISLKPDKKNLNLLKIKLSKKYNLKEIVRNSQIISMCLPNQRDKIIKILNIKPIRNISGVTVVALFAKPFNCPHGKCIYCPGGLNSEFGNTPQSYTGKEPAALRAIRNNYDPYFQIFNRLEHYVINGHFPDKLELIFMGGTFPSIDKNYRDEFVYFSYKAINDFGEEFVLIDKNFQKKINYEKFNDFFEVFSKIDSKKREKKIFEKINKLKFEKKLKIGIDIDDVLFDSLNCINWKNMPIDKEDIINFNFINKKKVDNKKIRKKYLEEFDKFIDKFVLDTQAKKVITKLKKLNHKLYIITSRDIKYKEKTINWLNKNFGEGFFKQIVFQKDNKSDFLKNKNFDIVIEDNPSQVLDYFENTNVNILMMKKSYNKFVKQNSRIKSVLDWNQIDLEIENFLKLNDFKSQIRKCQKSLIRPIGLTVETKPDFAKKEHCLEMLEYGCTRFEVGIQTLDENVLEKLNRGHSLEDTINCFKIMKDLCFKINAHMMIGLPFSNNKKDLDSIKKLFSDQNFRPDMLKIYPCLVTCGTILYQMFKKGEFKALDTKSATKIIGESFRYIPEYVRVMRVQRDIPLENIASGVENSNLREFVDKYLKENNICDLNIRFREIGFFSKNFKVLGNFKIKVLNYKASDSKEFFIQSVDENNALIGFIRLRFPKQTNLISEIDDKTALIRELHVFGKTLSVGILDKQDFQHKGWGKRLIEKAESIAKQNGFNKIAIISGIGVRQYYEKLGYKLEKFYMVKKI